VEWDGLDNNLDPFPASVDPYPYRAYGRNGEVHFPIVDAENNGNATVPGGGPTITRLNGLNPNDQTVFFDDRGYVTSSGQAVGNLNLTLCPNPTPAAVNPPVSLEGVNSSTSYRRWANGGNSNSDCNSNAGWGDAKAVNLWTYFLTNDVTQTLEIREFPVDLGTTVTVAASAAPGDTVQGTFSFANFGSSSVPMVGYSMTITPGLGTVSFANLPPGANANYDSGSGIVTLLNFPTTLAAGEAFNNMTFSYTAPASGTVTVTTGITTGGSTPDSVPENNTASAATAVGDVDLTTMITGIPADADPGATVSGSVLFTNAGPLDANGVTYTFSIGAPDNTPTNVQFTSLPAGVGASYNPVTGEVTLTGMPDTLVVGQVESISFSYTAPTTDGENIPISSGITTTSDDADLSNNNASADTGFSFPPGAGPGGGPTSIPTLPLPALLLLLGLVAGLGARHLKQHAS
jgi:hypothetical protein